MKHTLKIVLPLVLIIAILVAACVFFLAFRPDMTSSVFAYWADHFVERGRYERAISCYRMAGKLTPENERVPIVLAQTYVKAGNYTKAEYTLVSAITNDPEAIDLYLALSQTYMAQGKFLDAEQMLSRINHDAIRNEIDAMRPEAPVISPESGYYNDYIDISAEADYGTIYLTTNGAFPSSDDDIYASPIEIGSGETNVTAFCVGENGLISPVVRAGYTVGNVVEPVTLSDTAIDTYVREKLGKLPTDTLMSDELWTLTELELPEGVASLDDLVYFTGLKSLTLHPSTTADLAILGSITTLQDLKVSGCTLSAAAMEAIGSLPDLITLDISSCAVSNIEPLRDLTKLTSLNLSHNTIDDIAVLSAMTELTELWLSNNPVRTITYLNNCLKLQKLHVENCDIAKLTSIADNTSIEELYASNNAIDDISVLSGCSALRELHVDGNEIADISVLAELPELTVFRGDHNKITTLPAFDPATCKLVRFNVNYNEVTSLAPLAGLHTVNYIRADYNKVTDISCLQGNYCLIQIDVWDNPINTAPIAAMQEMGIKDIYNPTYKPA